jgi:hypothetical protein
LPVSCAAVRRFTKVHAPVRRKARRPRLVDRDAGSHCHRRSPADHAAKFGSCSGTWLVVRVEQLNNRNASV